jgi:DNA invertase Pin-like site-specific DNA recombinase
MSLAADDDTTKVADQERLGRQTAERLDWPVGSTYGYPLPNGVYQDNNKSAWKHDRKRPAWDQMLADIEAGIINAIVVYHGDRLTRQPMDLELLISLSRTRGIKLASATGVRDLNNDDDQFTLGIEANVYRKESASLSRRRKQQYERWALEGRVRPGGQGGRAFGYESDGITQVPEECAAIREMANRVLSGETPYAVGRDLTERGTRTPSGNAVTAAVVAYVLQRPRTAGLMPDGEAAAAWPAALERETWERVCLVLGARTAGFPGAGNARKWLLSGIALCGACGQPVTSGRARAVKGVPGVEVYRCVQPGCRKVSRSAPQLDEYVGGQVVTYLASPLHPAGRAPLPDRTAEWKILERERAETDGLLADYKASAGRARSLMTRLEQIDERMAELRDQAAGSSRARLLDRYRGITREQWKAETLSVRRALVAACFTVTVLPSSKRGPGFRTEDVRVEPVS